MYTTKLNPEDLKRLSGVIQGALARALEEVNPGKDEIERLVGRRREFENYIATGLSRFTSNMPDYTRARAILGNDLICAHEIMASRKVSYSRDQQIELGRKLPDQKTLEAIRDAGMMLVAGPPTAMSLIDVRAIHADYFYSKGPDQDDEGWYDEAKETFAKNDKVEALCWIALRKEPVENSLNKTWPDQQALVAELMMVPNAAEAVWALTTYKAVRDIYLLEDLYVRTSSVVSDGSRVDVGYFGAGGLYVSNYWDDGLDSDLGVAGSRKF